MFLPSWPAGCSILAPACSCLAGRLAVAYWHRLWYVHTTQAEVYIGRFYPVSRLPSQRISLFHFVTAQSPAPLPPGPPCRSRSKQGRWASCTSTTASPWPACLKSRAPLMARPSSPSVWAEWGWQKGPGGGRGGPGGGRRGRMSREVEDDQGGEIGRASCRERVSSPV